MSLNRTYVILTASQALGIDFDDVLQTSASTLTWNTDNTETLVKYEGTQPSWLAGRTTYTFPEIQAILKDPDGKWVATEL